LDDPQQLDDSEEHAPEDSMALFLERDAVVPCNNKDVDLTKGKLSKQLIKAYGFCKN